MILQMRTRRLGKGGPRCRRRKRREKEMRSRVSADESLLAVSDDLDKLTRMLGTCLSPVSRVNFASLYAISLSFSFSSLSRLIVDASISRKCGAAVRSVKWDFRRSLALRGDGTTTVDPPVWTPHVVHLARKGESGEWDRSDGWRTEREAMGRGGKEERRAPFLR